MSEFYKVILQLETTQEDMSDIIKGLQVHFRNSNLTLIGIEKLWPKVGE